MFKVKASIGAENIEAIEEAFMKSVLNRLSRDKVPNLCLLGDPNARSVL